MNILKAIQKKVRGIGRRIGLMDDFDWSSYNKEEYAKQVNDLERKYTFILPDGKFKVEGGKIKLDSGLLPLNEHHQALYESVLKLCPNSVLEVGFGCGDHLHNIKKLLPDVQLNGTDLLKAQLNFLEERHPGLKNQAKLAIADITLPLAEGMSADLVYTQAVLMHIQRYNSYLSALKNIFLSAKKYVVLQENWTRHNFFEDIKKISKESDFPWQNTHFYIYDAGRQVSLILSNSPLHLFKEIKSNQELLKYYNYY